VVVNGPQGNPEVLSEIADDRLVQAAMRLQAEQYFAQGDLWSIFCQADPGRALRGLHARAKAGDWDKEAWEGLLWAAHQKVKRNFSANWPMHSLRLPTSQLSHSSQRPWRGCNNGGRCFRTLLRPADRDIFNLWDMLADLAYTATRTTTNPNRARRISSTLH
jgi:hypothetical protein